MRQEQSCFSYQQSHACGHSPLPFCPDWRQLYNLAAGDERSGLQDVEIPFLPDVPVMAAILEHDAVERVRRLKPLSLLPLVALIFYDVSGGPFGIEVPGRLAGARCAPLRPVAQACMLQAMPLVEPAGAEPHSADAVRLIGAGCSQHRGPAGCGAGLCHPASHMERA